MEDLKLPELNPEDIVKLDTILDEIRKGKGGIFNIQAFAKKQWGENQPLYKCFAECLSNNNLSHLQTGRPDIYAQAISQKGLDFDSFHKEYERQEYKRQQQEMEKSLKRFQAELTVADNIDLLLMKTTAKSKWTIADSHLSAGVNNSIKNPTINIREASNDLILANRQLELIQIEMDKRKSVTVVKTLNPDEDIVFKILDFLDNRNNIFNITDSALQSNINAPIVKYKEAISYLEDGEIKYIGYKDVAPFGRTITTDGQDLKGYMKAKKQEAEEKVKPKQQGFLRKIWDNTSTGIKTFGAILLFFFAFIGVLPFFGIHSWGELKSTYNNQIEPVKKTPVPSDSLKMTKKR